MSAPDLSIVMPCYNRAYDLLKVLKAFDQQAGEPNFEVVAIDDHSTDHSYEVLQNFQPRNYELRVLHQDCNMGPGQARNAGIQVSRAALIAFVGDDTLPGGNFVKGHIQAHRTHPDNKTVVLGRVAWPEDLPANSLMEFIDGIGGRQFGFYYMQDGQEYDFRHFYTSNISLKTSLLKSENSWFDARYALAAFEDVDLGYRLSRQGMKIIYQANLIDYHYHYHTIWTFSRRQYNSGLMGALFLRKYPQVAFHYAFRPYFGRLLRLLKRPGSLITPLTLSLLTDLENKACRVASLYEWQSHTIIEQLYGSLLDYFFYAGFFEGYAPFAPLRRRLHSAHAMLYLAPALERFAERVGALPAL